MPSDKKSSESQLISTNLHRNFVWNMVGSTASALISLFLMMAVTRLNGIDDAGIFSFAFSTAMIFYTIGIYSGRTFQVTDKNQKTTDSDYFYLKFLTCFAMLVVGIVFCLIRGYSGEKFLITEVVKPLSCRYIWQNRHNRSVECLPVPPRFADSRESLSMRLHWRASHPP